MNQQIAYTHIQVNKAKITDPKAVLHTTVILHRQHVAIFLKPTINAHQHNRQTNYDYRRLHTSTTIARSTQQRRASRKPPERIFQDSHVCTFYPAIKMRERTPFLWWTVSKRARRGTRRKRRRRRRKTEREGNARKTEPKIASQWTVIAIDCSRSPLGWLKSRRRSGE